MTLGLDYAWSKPSPAAIKAAGYSFVCRYLSWLPNGKVATASELAALRAAGITIFLNWEYDARDQLGGTSAGRSHATEAVKQAKALGYPAGKTIYFSADFDATEGQQRAINDYMRAAGEVVHAAGYRIGIYGGFYVVKRAFDAGVTDDGWQTYAWSGGQWEPRAHLRQVKNGITVGGAACDRDEIVGEVYGWDGSEAPAPQPPPAPPKQRPDDEHALGSRQLWLTDPMLRGTDVKFVQGKTGSAPDGIFGPDTDRHVRAYQRSHGLGVDGIVGPRTWAALLAKPKPKPAAGRHAPGSRTIQRGDEGEDVTYVQRFIGTARCGQADGVFGPHTEAGVKWYQQMRGIAVDGIVGPVTWRNILGR